MTFIFPSVGKFIIPTDFHIFQRCRAQPPTRRFSPWSTYLRLHPEVAVSRWKSGTANRAVGPGRADGAEGLKVGAEDGAAWGVMKHGWLGHMIGKSNSMGDWDVGMLRCGSFIPLSLSIYLSIYIYIYGGADMLFMGKFIFVYIVLGKVHL